MSAYAVLPGAAHVSRVFLPLDHRREAGTPSWSRIARDAGEDLSASSDLYDLLGEPAAPGIHPYGEATSLRREGRPASCAPRTRTLMPPLLE